MLSEEELKELKEAELIKDMIATPGWGLIDSILKEKLGSIKMKRDQSDDPYTVMACVRQEDGIMFIYEVIQDFISRGNRPVNG